MRYFRYKQMKTVSALLLLFPLAVQSAEMEQVKNAELATTFSFLTELAHKNGIRIFSVPVAAAECWGAIKSCPDVKLFVVLSPEALYQEPVLYQLPKSKGWEFVRWIKSGSFVIRTTLPEANIDQNERARWRTSEYFVTVDSNNASYEIR